MGIGIIATTEDAAGQLVGTCQIGCGSQIALATVSVVAFVVLAAAVVPVVCACSLAQFCLGITVGPVGNGMDGLELAACCPVCVLNGFWFRLPLSKPPYDDQNS